MLTTMLNHINPGMLWGLQLLCVYSTILLMLRFFGATGLLALMGVLVIAANIQVNKLTMLPGFTSPMPLGNALIAGTYLCSDTLTEYFSARTARRGIWLAFSLFVFMIMCVIFTLGFHPLTPHAASQAGVTDPARMQNALLVVFGTAPALLIASLTSFLISQLSDIAIFTRIKRITGQRLLWLRNNVSTLIAALLDNFIFNILAWRIFATHPIPWHTLFISYIFGTYLMRVLVSVLDTPFIYLAKFSLGKRPNKNCLTQVD